MASYFLPLITPKPMHAITPGFVVVTAAEASAQLFEALSEVDLMAVRCSSRPLLRICTATLDRGPRRTSQNKMSFVALTLQGFRGVMIFAEDVLVHVTSTLISLSGVSQSGTSAHAPYAQFIECVEHNGSVPTCNSGKR